MARFRRFTFLVTPDERYLISVLAERLQRSQSDAVRFVVIEAVREIVLGGSFEPKEAIKEESNVQLSR
jgi:hypothetical protein